MRALQEKRIDGLIVASAGDDAVLAQTLADARRAACDRRPQY